MSDLKDLNDLIAHAYTKTCDRHNIAYNVLIGCVACLSDALRRLGG
jgi:hypothetical protein